MRLQFKTTIHCGNCVRAVSAFINEVPGVENWEVDTANPDKILTVEGPHLDEAAICAAVMEAGFEIAPLDSAPVQ